MKTPLVGAALLVLAACSDDAPAGAGGAASNGSAGSTVGAGGAAPCDPAEAVCAPLFGRPNALTGLTDDQCKPELTCGGQSWEAPVYGAAFVDALRGLTLLDPPALLDDDPYESDPPSTGLSEVCAVRFDDVDAAGYRVETFSSAAEAATQGAFVTHFGACGACSSLGDLAVYIEQEDLTEPVRRCGIQHLGGSPEEHMACLLELGFTEPCAQIWFFNTRHTRTVCAEPCFAALGEPYHLPDGSLNACLVCDEVESGPVFKAVAGRTRRNTGLANALCRPCDEVQPLVHDYL